MINRNRGKTGSADESGNTSLVFFTLGLILDSLSHITSNALANLVGSTFNIFPRSDLLSSPPLPLFWSKLRSSLGWIITVASQLIFLPLSQSIFYTTDRVIFLTISHIISPPCSKWLQWFPISLKRKFLAMASRSDIHALPALYLPLLSMTSFPSTFPHLPLLQRSSFSAVPWIHQAHFSLRALGPAVLSINNTFTPRHSHVTSFRCWLNCHLVDRVFSDHAI